MSAHQIPTVDALCFLRRASYLSLPSLQSRQCLRSKLHTSSTQHKATEPAPPAPPTPAPQTPVRPKPNRPHIRAYDGELQPQPLSRPLGLPHPPQAGQNTGADRRNLRQRRDDFVSYDKHLERRKTLFKELYQKNYFRDIGNLGKIHKGKSIIAPTTPFRETVARWFPNLHGRTLEGPNRDTTPVLRGHISVVSLVNTEWAKDQCQSFVGAQQNPALHEYLASSGAKDTAQMVEINVEENWIKAALVRLFMGRIRRGLPADQHGKYFLVTRGVTDEIRDALAMWNAKVGYVYLVDQHCKVRWAGNGPAREDERKSLVSCLKRLVDEANGVKRVTVQPPRPTSPATKPVAFEPAKAAASAG